jgi:hypothetical protein
MVASDKRQLCRSGLVTRSAAILVVGLLLSGCCPSEKEDDVHRWASFGDASETNGFLCGRAHPDWTETQCSDHYHKVLNGERPDD